MAEHVEVPYASLSAEALDGLIDEFVTRDGTDYGVREHSLAEKRASVMKQLERAEVVIVFDPESSTTTLLTRGQLRVR
jgi:hypothetical protein